MSTYRSLLCFSLALLSSIGCTNARPGQVMIAIRTDMSVPEDLDSMRIEVTSLGLVRHQVDYALGAGNLLLPGTLALVSGEDPAPTTVRVAAQRDRGWTTLREAVISNYPGEEQIHTIHMPIQWLCTGEDSITNSSRFADDPVTSCPDGRTCIAGTCVDEEVDAQELPEFSEEDVFGGDVDGMGDDAATCFDTLGCFEDGSGVEAAQFDPDRCTITDVDIDSLNVGMLVPRGAGGICPDDESAPCIVPLDRDDQTGWTESGGNARLPGAVCDRIEDGRVTSLVITNSCPTKTRSNGTCGPWSSVGGEGDATTNADTPMDVVDLSEVASSRADAGAGGLAMEQPQQGTDEPTQNSSFEIVSDFTGASLAAGEAGLWRYASEDAPLEPTVVEGSYLGGTDVLDYAFADSEGNDLVMTLDVFSFTAEDTEVFSVDLSAYDSFQFSAGPSSDLASEITVRVFTYNFDQVPTTSGGDCDVSSDIQCPEAAGVDVGIRTGAQLDPYVVTFDRFLAASEALQAMDERVLEFDPSDVVGFGFRCEDERFTDGDVSIGIDDVGLNLAP